MGDIGYKFSLILFQCAQLMSHVIKGSRNISQFSGTGDRQGIGVISVVVVHSRFFQFFSGQWINRIYRTRTRNEMAYTISSVR